MMMIMLMIYTFFFQEMLRLSNKKYLDVIFSKHGGNVLSGFTNIRYLYNSKDDFEKLMIPMKTNKLLVKEHDGELKKQFRY